MAHQDVGEKPDHQTERLCEHAYDLDYRHQRQRNLQPGRHIRPENVFPVMLVSEYVDGEEGKQREYQRHRNVASHIGPSGEERHDAHQVVNEYEEECRQQIRRITLVVVAYTILYDVILNHRHQHLEQAHSPPGSLFAGIMLPVPGRAAEHNDQQDKAVDEQTCDILGDRKVPRPDKRTVRSPFDNLSGIFPLIRNAESGIFIAMMQMPRTEAMRAPSLLADDNHRKRYADFVTVDSGDVPLVGITHVAVEIFIHVQRLPVLRRQCRRKQEKKNECPQKPFHHDHNSTQAMILLLLTVTKPDRTRISSRVPSSVVYLTGPLSSEETRGAWSRRTMNGPRAPQNSTDRTLQSSNVLSGLITFRTSVEFLASIGELLVSIGELLVSIRKSYLL